MIILTFPITFVFFSFSSLLPLSSSLFSLSSSLLDYSHGGETGSRYARSLGFFDEPSWENINQKNREDIENEYEGIEMKIEKTRKKVRTHVRDTLQMYCVD
jgi:hypothetical protein